MSDRQDREEGAGHLPERYRDDRLHVLATGSTRCWVYWDEGMAVERLATAYLPNDWQQAPRQLRVRGTHDVERVVACRAEFGSTYLEGLEPGGRYRVEYGFMIEGSFLPLYEHQVLLPGRSGKEVSAVIVRERAEGISSYSLYRQA
ncbi:MAG: hypothetical protein ACXVDE_02935 [Tumebacillaceae bacterium]